MTALEPAIKPPPRNFGERVSRVFNKAPIHVALILIALVWLLPTIGLLITSFRPRGEIQSSGWWTVFAGHFDFTISNYQQVLQQGNMLQAFYNSVSIVVPSTILPLVLSAMAAFAFAWIKFPGRDVLFLSVIAMLLIPAQMTFIPLSRLVGQTGLGGTFLPIWLVHTAFALPFGIFLLRNFFITLPKDLIEAARIDGAGNVDIFRRIVVPLSVPALASLGIFQFLWTWNDLLMALVFAPRQGQPMTVQITTLLGTYASEWYILAAASFLVMIVPLAVFFSLQRYFVQGLLAGSVK